MVDQKAPAEAFERERPRLRRLAYRLLGGLAEAEDAVQEAWLRLSRAGPADLANPGGWLTTVLTRICIDMLRARAHRREAPLSPDPMGGAAPAEPPDPSDLERETELADSVGAALLVVLDALAPAERIAFVLHDMFDLPFDEIAPMVGRTTTPTRQPASRARRRIRGASPPPAAELERKRQVVAASAAASRAGDFDALLP